MLTLCTLVQSVRKWNVNKLWASPPAISVLKSGTDRGLLCLPYLFFWEFIFLVRPTLGIGNKSFANVESPAKATVSMVELMVELYCCLDDDRASAYLGMRS